MTRGGGERTALAAALAWLCSAGLGPIPAQAQAPATAVPNGTRDATIDFDIPAQPMAAALNSWAVQANAQVFVDPGPVAHVMAPAVKGTLTPRQALRALLARSNLQVAQGANGVFVIKTRPATVAAAQPATPARATPAGAAPPAAAPAALRARDREGAWAVGLLADYALDDGVAGGGAAAAVEGEYFITDHTAAALALSAPRTHSFAGGSVHRQSSTLSFRYYFAPESRLRPYLDAGIAVTALYDARGVAGLDRVTAGPAVAAGVDWSLSTHWLLTAAIGSQGRDFHLDPLQFGLGFSYRFGR